MTELPHSGLTIAPPAGPNSPTLSADCLFHPRSAPERTLPPAAPETSRSNSLLKRLPTATKLQATLSDHPRNPLPPCRLTQN